MRGYDLLPPLDLHSVEGGGLVANGTTLFAGMNFLGMHRDKYHGVTYAKAHVLQQAAKISPGKTISLEYPYSREHADMMLVPFDERRIGFGNVAKTVSLLHRNGIALNHAEDAENRRLNDAVEECREMLQSEGFTLVDLPLAYLQEKTRLCMVTYSNVLMDTHRAYIPVRQDAESPRFAKAAKLMDGWAFDTFAQFKEPVPIAGFEQPQAWYSAALRCTFNVLARS
jgi:hypothetical protein